MAHEYPAPCSAAKSRGLITIDQLGPSRGESGMRSSFVDLGSPVIRVRLPKLETTIRGSKVRRATILSELGQVRGADPANLTYVEHVWAVLISANA